MRDPIHERRRGARAVGLRGGAARRRPAGHAAHHRGGAVGLLRPGRRGAARLDPAARRMGGRERRRAHRRDGRRQRARALEGRSKEAGARAEGAQGADGDLDEPLGGRRVPLGADAVSHARVRERGGDVAARLRGLLLRSLPCRRLRPADRLAAPVGPGEPPGRVDRGQGAGAHQGARHRHHARRGRASLDSLRGRAQHARRRVLHRSHRGLGERRDQLLVSGELRRADRLGRALSLRGRQGGRRLGRSGRGLPDRDARHRRRGAPPGRARASAPTTASPRPPRRSSSTRRSAGPSTWRSG